MKHRRAASSPAADACLLSMSANARQNSSPTEASALSEDHAMKDCFQLLTLTLTVAACPAAKAAAAERPPNIVYIMSDELAYYELSHMGQPADSHAAHRPDGGGGHAIHAGPGRGAGLRAAALHADDRQAHGTRFRARQRRRDAAAGRGADRSPRC